MTYQKCDYRIVDFERDIGTAERQLNELAKEGFELERVVGDRIGIMRREFRSERMDRSFDRFIQPKPAPAQPPKEEKEL